MWMGVFLRTSAANLSDFVFQRHLRLFGSVIMDPITPSPEKPNLLSEKSKIEKLRITNYELQITNEKDTIICNDGTGV